MAAETWGEYWDRDDFWSRSRLWQVNDRVFLRRAEPLVGFRGDDTVCSIGCGPGRMERLLAPRVKSICALDISPRFVEMCRQNCRDRDNVTGQALGEDYTDLSVAGGPFSLFLCVSVVQYYDNPRRIEDLVRSASSVAEPGGRMLMADLPRRRGPAGRLWDAGCSVARSAVGGYAPTLFAAAWSLYVRRNAYRLFSGERRTLEFTLPEIRAMIDRLGVDATIVRRSLSVYANRPSVLIRF